MQESELLENLRRSPFVLAPMAGITDRAFRSFMRELGASIVITELVSAHGLKYNSSKTFQLMEYEECQRPIGIQIFGETPEAMSEAAKIVEDYGADFVDINFGCPVSKVVKKGAGSAMLKDLPAFRQILRATKNAVKIPVTIKVRTGWDESSRNTIEVTKIAHEEGITWVAIHGRTRAAGYSGRADWEYIREVKKHSPLPIIGNGDLTSPTLAVSRLRESGCDGVMIGRGCLKNPWIFKQALAQWSGSEACRESQNFLLLIERLRGHLERTSDERIVGLQLKKFSAWYAHGYPGAAAFRKALFQQQSLPELSRTIYEYFGAVGSEVQADTSHEAFLMGGHG